MLQSSSLIEFLQKMMQKDPEKRATIKDLLTDKWLTRDMKNPLIIFNPIETELSEDSSELDLISEKDEVDFDIEFI